MVAFWLIVAVMCLNLIVGLIVCYHDAKLDWYKARLAEFRKRK